MYNKETKNGYRILALVENKSIREDGIQLYTMVGEKYIIGMGVEFVVGTNYMVEDGTWGHGSYCYSYEDAMNILAKKISTEG